MKKILLLTDTCSSLSKEVAKELDVCILPLSIYDQDGKQYANNDLDFSHEHILKLQESGTVFSTGCTSQLLLEETIKSNLVNYDYILALPISSKWSSQYSHIKALSNQPDFKEKLYVADVLDFGFNIEILCRELREKINSGIDDIDELIKYAEDFHNFTLSFFVCKQLKGLVDSGRVPNVVAKLFKLTKIYPIIKVDQENHFGGIVKKWDEAIPECIKQLIKNFDGNLTKNDIRNISIISLDCSKEYINQVKKLIVDALEIDESIIQIRNAPDIFVHIVSRGAIGLQVVANKRKHKTNLSEKIKKIF